MQRMEQGLLLGLKQNIKKNGKVRFLIKKQL